MTPEQFRAFLKMLNAIRLDIRATQAGVPSTTQLADATAHAALEIAEMLVMAEEREWKVRA